MRALTACMLMMLLCPHALALDVVPLFENRHIGVAISAVTFPESLTKDLASGLTNKLLVRVVLLRDSQPIAQRAVEISVRYDLWDEKFRLAMRIDDAAPANGVYDNPQGVIKFLTTLRIPQLFPVNDLPRSDFIIRVDMLLNPIERERIDKIRKWVADNSTYLPADAGSFDSGRALDARSNVLFNKIFEQYFAGADVAAAWQQSSTSKPFNPQDLGNAR